MLALSYKIGGSYLELVKYINDTGLDLFLES